MSITTGVIEWMLANSETLVDQTIQHLNLSFTAIVFGTLLWTTVGILIHKRESLANTVIGAAGIVLTIPSLVLFPLLIPVLGIGTEPTVTALLLYSALPITRNTYRGIQSVDSSALKVGRGLGMSERQLLRKVKLPHAMPVIMAGIRQAGVLLIAITNIAAFFGAGGLGQSIFAGIRLNNSVQIIGATLVVSSIALVFDYGLYAIQRQLPGGSEVSAT